MKALNPDIIAAPFAAYSHGVASNARRTVSGFPREEYVVEIETL
jgi:hypothetical protein